VQSFSVSLDGFGAGPQQSLENPLGSGEPRWNGINLRALGYESASQVQGERAMHVFLRRRS